MYGDCSTFRYIHAFASTNASVFFIKMCKINPFFYFASFDAVALRAFIVKEV